ncbi:GNAT family N-acetyltransferase [Streptococcus moroccensis]|uniref:RimJ/RimL family protein N-acetyltransferase n=1 Tax=Streptococcus moroccensis TaxID=1451356 RepID=A0ABT9YSD7_9STRE|nr:GNAT family protein [Streptococcus moroccensis]MDQ0222634.1 RimJ/RimL family protein N-acetyltransferase [Streptococcus moroccensis]
MKLSLYSEREHESSLRPYSLNDTTHTDTPKNIIKMSQKDNTRYPIVILYKNSELDGFFCLHINTGSKEYSYYQSDYVLIRGFSIDDTLRNQGYASNALPGIFDFIDSSLKLEINHIVLTVNEQNSLAQKAYKNLGFVTVKRDFEGKKGKLKIMVKSRNQSR